MSVIRRNATRTAAALAAGLLGGIAHAQSVDFSGYGTLAAAYNRSDQGDFRTSWRQSDGGRHGVDAGADSRLGGQANVKFNDTFSATAQALAIRRDGANFKLDAEWLYGQAQATPGLSLRAGRLVLPTFMQSDVRNVGFAQHWLRAPSDVYINFPADAVDGVQVLYFTNLDGFRVTVQPTFGHAKAKLFFDVGPFQLHDQAVLRDIKSLNLSAEKGSWTLRAGETVSNGSLTIENVPTTPTDRFIDRFTSVGAQYDDDRLLVMAEFVSRNTSTMGYDSRSWYASTGYRLGAWMPYATVSHLNNLGTRVKPNGPTHTQAVGLRWDAMKNVDLKLQAESTTLAGQQFTHVDPAASHTKSVGVVSLALDFVF